jgi:hypothetical protein
MDDQKAVEQYLNAGVDLPELKEQQAPETEPEAQQEESKPEEPQEPLTEENTERTKRSIYDAYKDKKAEVRSERDARLQAEKERDELKTRLEALNSAQTPQERQYAQDEIDAFAQDNGLDAQALRKMRELFTKDVRLDESLLRDIEDIKAFKEQHSQAFEKQMFEEEFRKVSPTLKEMFKGANDEELDAIKVELDRISHTSEYHDKELDYVAYKHRNTLESLISPKKRGLEPKTRRDAPEESTDFDPDADFASMTPKQRDSWEKQYKQLTKSDGLMTDAEGRKIII